MEPERPPPKKPHRAISHRLSPTLTSPQIFEQLYRPGGSVQKHDKPGKGSGHKHSRGHGDTGNGTGRGVGGGGGSKMGALGRAGAVSSDLIPRDGAGQRGRRVGTAPPGAAPSLWGRRARLPAPPRGGPGLQPGVPFARSPVSRRRAGRDGDGPWGDFGGVLGRLWGVQPGVGGSPCQPQWGSGAGDPWVKPFYFFGVARGSPHHTAPEVSFLGGHSPAACRCGVTSLVP